jgi:hypothetical protein
MTERSNLEKQVHETHTNMHTHTHIQKFAGRRFFSYWVDFVRST